MDNKLETPEVHQQREDLARKNALQFFNGDTLAAEVWLSKYSMKIPEGKRVELHPKDTVHRVAKNIAFFALRKTTFDWKKMRRRPPMFTNLETYEMLVSDMLSGKFIFGGSVLFGAGNWATYSSLGNCFVIGDKDDSYSGIMRTDEEQIQLMKRRGGVGHDISHLRPRGARVNNAAGSSTGPVSFMHRYSNSTREVAQEGRRGALMLTMDANHPDIMEFIRSKSDLTKITGANISVKVYDDMMREAKRTKEHHPVLKELAQAAWETGEPGILYWDNVRDMSPADKYPGFESVSTNPCGEIPLCPYDSCRLGSINLSKLVDWGEPYNSSTRVRFLDNAFHMGFVGQFYMDLAIDSEEARIQDILSKLESEKPGQETVEKALWKKILKKLKMGRRTGLGITGWGDLLAKFELEYGSEASLNLAFNTMRAVAMGSYACSAHMAKYYGPFEAYDPKIDSEIPFVLRVMHELNTKEDAAKKAYGYYRKYGRRNISNLTIAPNGSLSILLGCTSGMEPVFQAAYSRRRKVTKEEPHDFVDATGDCWQTYNVIHGGLVEWYAFRYAMDLTEARTLLQTMPEETLRMVVRESPYYGSEAHNVDPETKLVMQSMLQTWVDHSISMTLNLPNSATWEEVYEYYILGHTLRLKGLTVYRDGCRDGVLLTKKSQEPKSAIPTTNAPKRPKMLQCDIHRASSSKKNHTVIVGLYQGKPFEIFASNKFVVPHKEGWVRKVQRGRYDLIDAHGLVLVEDITSGMSPEQEVVTRLASMGLRHGADIKFIVEQLGKSQDNMASFSKILARTLKKYIKDGEPVSGAACPECGGRLIYEGGCNHCTDCPYETC